MTDWLMFPDRSLAMPRARSHNAVRIWLAAVAALVFLMVIVGGATRLTESGLSITEWKPISGVIPPLNEAQWLAEFDKYKQIPQFSQLAPDMTLGGFKFIFFWEWGHRLLGRVIGLAFGLPLLWFAVTRQIPRGMGTRLAALLVLGGLQGLVGWWMVKSGLSERVEVSQYRLAVHLLLASLTFAGLVWLASSLRPRAGTAGRGLKVLGSAVVVAVFLQIGLGALVAGLRAGLDYNTWPLMDGKLVPPLADLARLTPAWSNLFENHTTVQFLHRASAYLLLVLVAVQAFVVWPAGGARNSRAAILAALVLWQAAIGIATLVWGVPLWTALLHQASAMLVLGMAVVYRERLG